MNIIVIFGTNEKNSNLNFDTNHISFFHSVQGEPAICSVLINNLWQKSAYPCVLGCQPASKCLLWFTRASSFQMSLMLMRKYMSIHPASKCRFCVVIWALWALHPRVLLLWRLFQPQTYDFNHQWAWPESHEPYWSRKHGSNWSRFLAY